MPSAGFYSIHTDTIRFAKDGRWYADDEPITHARLALLFSRHLRRKADGGFEIWIDERYHADVVVDDTAFVVVDVDVEPSGTVTLHLNDGSTEPLDPRSLEIGADDVLYCRVKAVGERARFLRTAYLYLAAHIEPDDVGGTGFILKLADAVYPIAVRAADA